MKATTRITSFILGAALMASVSASWVDAQLVLDPGTTIGLTPSCKMVELDNDCDFAICSAEVNCTATSVQAVAAWGTGNPGESSATGYLYASFKISGTDPVNVPVTITANIEITGIIEGAGLLSSAGYHVKMVARDVTDGANRLIADKIIVKSDCGDVTTTFCGSYDTPSTSANLDASLIRGHTYTVGFEARAYTSGGVALAFASEVDVRTVDVPGIKVTIGKDPFEQIGNLVERTTALEERTTTLEERTTTLEERTTTLEAETAATQSALEALEAAFNAEMAATRLALAELQTTFNSHQHTYRTGEGIGHNKVMSATTPPDGAVSSASSDVGALGRLSAVDVNGSESGHAPVMQGQATGVGSEPAVVFALEGVRPNPASGRDLRVAFALTSGAPAQLELLDVRGRQVMSSAVGSLGAGRHMVSLAEGGRVAPGVYWVRLTQGVNQRTTQVVVIE